MRKERKVSKNEIKEEKIYEFLPSYARKRENVFYRKNAYKWRKIKENQYFQGVSYK